MKKFLNYGLTIVKAPIVDNNTGSRWIVSLFDALNSSIIHIGSVKRRESVRNCLVFIAGLDGFLIKINAYDEFGAACKQVIAISIKVAID